MRIGIIIILTSIFVPLAMIFLMRGSKETDCVIYKPPGVMAFVGMVGLVISIGLGALSFIQDFVLELEYTEVQLWFTYTTVTVFSLLSLWLIMFWALWRVELKDDYLYHRNSFGIVKKIPYSEINKVVEERERDGNALRGYVVHYANKKSFFIEFLIVGSEGFLNALKKKMRAHGCKLDTEIKPVGFAPKKKK